MTLEEKARKRLKELNEEFVELEKESATVEQKKRDVNLKIEEVKNLLSEENTESVPRSVPRRRLIIRIPHVRTDVKKSIVDILNKNDEEEFAPTDLAKELLNMGVKSDAQDFTHLVRTTLGHLRRAGEVYFRDVDGKRLYSSLKGQKAKENQEQSLIKD